MTEDTIDWLIARLAKINWGLSVQFDKYGVCAMHWHAMEIAG